MDREVFGQSYTGQRWCGHSRILRAQEDFLPYDQLSEHLLLLEKAKQEGNILSLREIFKTTVSGFNPDQEIADVVYLQNNKLK